jgi:hypothetical protein
MKALALLLASIGALLLAAPAAAQSATWLDGRPAAWNAPGGALPTPPAAYVGAGDPRCADRERAPSGAEESAVRAAGWRLAEFWPTQRAGDLAVVVGTAGYDGMCRPMGYQGFAFAAGRFAGTLSPEPINSRADGALVTTQQGAAVRLVDGKVEARFVRYAPTDPLCCPSRGHAVVTYRVAAGPQLLIDARADEPPAIASAPTQLPRTGGLDIAWLGAAAGVGAVLALAGLAVRRRVR